MDKREYSKQNYNFFNDSVHKDENFFIYQDLASLYDNPISKNRHLNDYDFNILQENAYQNLKDELLKIELKINKIENDINNINEQIIIANDLNDFSDLNWLNSRKIKLESELVGLKTLYNETSISARFSDKITNFVPKDLKNRTSKIYNFLKFLPNCIRKILPQRILSFLELKTSLKKLETLQKSVNELMSNQAPYGELETQYERLSTYITKANNMQSQLHKNFYKK